MKEKERQNVECGSGHVLGSARVVQFWGFLWCEILGGWEGHRWDKRGKQFPSVILSLKAVWLPLESYVHFYFLRCNSLNSIIIRQQLLHSWKEKKKILNIRVFVSLQNTQQSFEWKDHFSLVIRFGIKASRW